MQYHMNLWAILLMLIWVGGCRDRDGSVDTSSIKSDRGSFDSPQVAFDAIAEALREDDWKTAASCMDEESQTRLAGTLVFAIAWLAGPDEEKSMAAESLFKKYGIDPDAEPDDDNGVASLASGVKKKPEFIAELFTFAAEYTPDDDFDRLGQIWTGTLVELKTEGDVAAGIIKIRDQEDEPIEFRKIDGSWKVHLPVKMFGTG